MDVLRRPSVAHRESFASTNFSERSRASMLESGSLTNWKSPSLPGSRRPTISGMPKRASEVPLLLGAPSVMLV